MGLITQSWLMDLESNMKYLTEVEYNRLTANLWWQNVARVRPSGSRKEIINWLLSTAMIEDLGSGGNIAFEDMTFLEWDYTNKDAGIGLRLRKQQFEDQDGNGVNAAAEWSTQIGAYMAYWPQKQIAKLIRDGDSTLCYDGKYYFATDHPCNPYNSGAGTYANLLTSTASGIYPGACPIDTSVSVDVALQNLGKAIAYIAQIKMPNGEDPRGLRPKFLMGGPALMPRMQQLSNAKLIAQAAGTYGGGGADVSAIVSNWGIGQPIQADELGYQTGYTHGATTYYIVCEQIASTQMGGMIWSDREPFKVNYYTGDGGGTGVDAILARARELEWQCHGRNVAAPGHPFLIFQVRGS